MHHLDGDRAVEPDVQGQVDGRHAAPGDPGLDAVTPVEELPDERVRKRRVHGPSLRAICTSAEIPRVVNRCRDVVWFFYGCRGERRPLRIGVGVCARPAGPDGPRSTARAHGLRHQIRPLGPGHRRGQQHRVAAQLHRQRGVAGRADPGVQDHRHLSPNSTMSSMLCGLRMPSPEPIGAPSGITAAQPAAPACAPGPGRRRCTAAPRTRRRPAARPRRRSRSGSGSRVRSSAMTSSLTQLVSSASLASRAVSTASPAVKQPAVFGRTLMSRSRSTSSTEPRARRVEPPHRDGGQLGPRGGQRLVQHLQRGRAAGAHDEPGGELLPADDEVVAHVAIRHLSVILPAPR